MYGLSMGSLDSKSPVSKTFWPEYILLPWSNLLPIDKDYISLWALVLQKLEFNETHTHTHAHVSFLMITVGYGGRVGNIHSFT